MASRQGESLASLLARALPLLTSGRAAEAKPLYEKALKKQPSNPEILHLLGLCHYYLQQHEDAIFLLRRATQLAKAPGYFANLGVALQDSGRFEEAASAYREATRLKPDYPEAWSNLGAAFARLGRTEEAITAYRRAVELRPELAEPVAQLLHLRRAACDWREFDEDEARLLALARRSELMPPFILATATSSRTAQLACARRYAARLEVPPAELLPRRKRSGSGKIRIGYLSGDFYRHATANLIVELFELHDRSRFEIAGYSYGRDDASPMRKRLVGAFDRFVELRGIADAASARRIHEDGIDILIDLKGFTQDARARILAYRPASVQVTYLGFPATMGARFVDYLIADGIVAPPEHQGDYAERIVQLPDCYQPNDRQRAAVETPSRIACGLPERGFVFCSFNSSYKITPSFFDIWMRLLAAIPGSALWLLESNPLAEHNLRGEAAARGIAGERLIFAPRLDLPQHLARHRHADLFLDTLPCNAHTTASDALWSGLPLLTCRGETFAGRVAASLLHAVGLPELIATTPAEYESLALRLAGDPQHLAELRSKLERNRRITPLFDTPRLTRNLEAAYLRMQELSLAGKPPAAFTVVP